VQGDLLMFSSLGLIIVGNGFFKPNISTLLGNLYSEPAIRRPERFRLQYLLHGHQYRGFYGAVRGLLYAEYVTAGVMRLQRRASGCSWAC
jgi:dipeptide/tripeptide permease